MQRDCAILEQPLMTNTNGTRVGSYGRDRKLVVKRRLKLGGIPKISFLGTQDPWKCMEDKEENLLMYNYNIAKI